MIKLEFVAKCSLSEYDGELTRSMVGSGGRSLWALAL